MALGTAAAATSRPMIVQGDGTILLDVESDSYQRCRDWLSRFAELVKSPEHVHTYRLTPLAIWNAAASGLRCEEVLGVLQKFSKYEVPQNILADVKDWFSRYGKLRLEKMIAGEAQETFSHAASSMMAPSEVSSRLYPWLILRSDDELLVEELMNNRTVSQYVKRRLDSKVLLIDPANRGRVKQALIKVSYPVEDLVGYLAGEPLGITLRDMSLSDGRPFSPRRYQLDAAEAFHASGSERGGSGVVVLPCGAGKTIVGMEIMCRVGEETLIIGSSTVGVRQWITELLDKTNLSRDAIGEYTGDVKEVKPVTVTTYQCLTYNSSSRGGNNNGGRSSLLSPSAVAEGANGGPDDDDDSITQDRRRDESGDQPGREGEYPHLEVFKAKNWGLIIYDEVHLLPAPVFRMTAELQAKRRLGLTATLVREDGREDDVFSLIGPKRFDAPWKELEAQGWIAEAVCHEIRVPISDYAYRMRYATSPARMKYRVAAENPRKFEIVRKLISEHRDKDCILVMGDYIDQLQTIASFTGAPLITGKTPNSERERLFSLFRKGEVKLLVVSKVANYAIDLPDANVAIQVSGTFGSRQEEAQRLGRLLRPKEPNRQAHFYTVVSKDTVDQEYASRRQLFLTERGYGYNIIDSDDETQR